MWTGAFVGHGGTGCKFYAAHIKERLFLCLSPDPQKMFGFLLDIDIIALTADVMYHGYDLVCDFQYNARRYKIHMFYVLAKTAYEKPTFTFFFAVAMMRALFWLYRRNEFAARVMHSVFAYLIA